FCNKRFPFEWRSSLAISVFEPKPEDLPEDLCEGIITYLKVTCTITGYQPTKAETDRAYDHFLPPFGNVPTEGQLDDILRDYWACYGVLLNVAVFPFPATPRVEAKVVHRAPTAVTMEAYKGTQLVGSQTTGPAQLQIHELKIEGEEIDRVVFKAPQNEGFLAEFTHYVSRDVPVDLKD